MVAGATGASALNTTSAGMPIGKAEGARKAAESAAFRSSVGQKSVIEDCMRRG